MRTKDILSTFLLCVGLASSQGLLADNHSEPGKSVEMDTEATRALVEQFNEAWVNNDDVKMAPLASDDVIQGYPPHGDIHVGREAVVAYITGKSGSTADEILKVDTMVRTVHKLVVEGDTAVGFHHMTAELAGGGTYSNEYVWRYTCANGKVIRLDGYVDTLHVVKQIGNHPALTERDN